MDPIGCSNIPHSPSSSQNQENSKKTSGNMGWKIITFPITILKGSLHFLQQLFSKCFSCRNETNLNDRVQKKLKNTGEKTMEYVALMALGFKGKLDEFGVNTKEKYANKMTPEFRGDPLFTPIPFSTSEDSPQTVSSKVEEIYKEHLKKEGVAAGPFGDYISILKYEPQKYMITQIAHKAFPKPGLAADLVVVFKSKNLQNNDQYFMLTGTRDRDPGKEKNATIGGFTGIEPRDRHLPASKSNPQVLDSEIFTIFKEAREESGLEIEIENIPDYREDDNVTEVEGKVRCGKEREYPAHIIKLGTFRTGEIERLADHTKRVYKTTAFACLVNLHDERIDLANKTNDFFKNFKLKPEAGEDIKGLQVHDITRAVLEGSEDAQHELAGRLQFGIEHHNAFLAPTIQAVRQFF